MNNLDELNDAMEFGSRVDFDLERLSNSVYSFGEQSNWSEGYKRNIAQSEIKKYEERVKNLIKIIDDKYSGVKFAEDRKASLQKELEKLKEVAKGCM